MDTVLLFTRHPTPGHCKTRLIPALGPHGAAEVQRQLTEWLVARLKPAAAAGRYRLVIAHTGASQRAMRRWLGPGPVWLEQGPGDLGARLNRATQWAFRHGASRVLVLGADCPDVTPNLLEQAFAALTQAPLVLGPARDGGYYLIGLRGPCPELFGHIPWGSPAVLQTTLDRARRLDLQTVLLPPLQDVDEPVDLRHWHELKSQTVSLAVVIPTFNEVRQIASTVRAVAADGPNEILVADGGSTDGTVERAAHAGARVLQAPKGRARQMNAAAAAARSDLLFFLHADTLPPTGYARIIRRTLERPVVAAGAFRFSLREPIPGRALVQTLVALRCTLFGTPFGDQGLFVRRELFLALGGFADLPLLEDLEILSRLRRWGTVRVCREAAATSARRWQQRGIWRTFLLNHLIIVGYHLGASPARLARLYYGPGAPRRGPSPFTGPAQAGEDPPAQNLRAAKTDPHTAGS